MERTGAVVLVVLVALVVGTGCGDDSATPDRMPAGDGDTAGMGGDGDGDGVDYFGSDPARNEVT